MKKIGIKLGVCALALMMAMSFIGCDNGGGGGRQNVQDGTFITEGFGFHQITPLTVATTFARNTIVRITVLEHAETVPMLETTERLLIPRIIAQQSIAVDAIAGSTQSSMGILYAVAAAIDEAGGNSAQWEVSPRRSNRVAVIAADGAGTPFDVIVVGLGITGVSAFLAASEGPAPNPTATSSDTTVIGLEWAGAIGGTSATAGGGFALNAQWIVELYPDLDIPAAIADAANAAGVTAPTLVDAQGNAFYSGPVDLWIQAAQESFGDDRAPWPEGPGLAGGARMNVVERFFRVSGETVDWLGRPPYNMGFIRPRLWGSPIRPGLGMPLHNWGGGEWVHVPPGFGTPPHPEWGFDNDDPLDLHKPIMWDRALTIARSRNQANQIMFETRARSILLDSATGDIIGVEATYHDGTTFLVMGRSIVLATGGFIGNHQMLREIHGPVLRPLAVTTNYGDGIRMAQGIGARTYNLHMAGAAHIAHLRHIIQTRINHPQVTSQEIDGRWKATLAGILMRPHNLIVATESGQDGVDRRGRRFIAEGGGVAQVPIGIGTGLGNAGARAGGFWAAIFSSDQLYRLETNPVGFQQSTMWTAQAQGLGVPVGEPVPFLQPLLDWGRSVGNVIRSPNLEDLARQLGVPYAALMETINAYNENVERALSPEFATLTGNPDAWQAASNDPYGKPLTTGGGAGMQRVWEQPVNLDAPMFYAILGATMFYGTIGGLDINEDFQVYNMQGIPIPGLFAGGQDAGGVIHHRERLYSTFGGKIHGFAMTSGRWAGYNAAAAARR